MILDASVSVVDDDEAMRDALGSLLRSVGYRVSSFSSGQAFLSSACLDDVRCLVTDIQMPEMSGIDLKNELTARGRTFPVVMITARMEEHVQRLALASKPFCLLRKPFDANELIRCVAEATQ